MPCFPSSHGSSGSPSRSPPNSLGSSGLAQAVFIGSCGVHSHDNGTDFMSQYLTPLASSLPGIAPGPLVHLGGIPHGQRSVPSTGCSLHASSFYGLGGTSCVPGPCGECPARPCPSRHYFHGALSPGSRRGYFWVALMPWCSMCDLTPSFH
jgi:hypothetical protein